MSGIVSDLSKYYAHRAIADYHGNLSSVLHCVAKNWIPPSNDPITVAYVEKLQDFLVARGQCETDSFLLRFAITAPGTQRGIIPPILVLEENRGGYNERRQQESASQVRRLRDAITLGRSLFSNLPEESLDSIRMLESIASEKTKLSDEAILSAFDTFGENELHEYSNKAVALLKNDCGAAQEVGINMLKDLACFRESPLPESVISTLLDLQTYWPAILYRSSSENVVAQLLHRIGKSSSKRDIDHLLLCLAWNQSDIARSAFVEWSQKPPTWSSILNLAAVEYAMYAGWAIDKNGTLTALIEKECYRLPISTTSPKNSISCLVETKSYCPSCHGKLSQLFDFRNLNSDLSQKLFAGNRINAPKVFQTCLHCSVYDTVFDRYSVDESCDRICPLTPCEYPNSGDHVDSNFRTVANETSSPYATAEPFMLDDATSLGGMPSWLQDANFPRCLSCDVLMIFFGQHDNGSLSGEGIYYAFFCPACQISAVNYQQT